MKKHPSLERNQQLLYKRYLYVKSTLRSFSNSNIIYELLTINGDGTASVRIKTSKARRPERDEVKML